MGMKKFDYAAYAEAMDGLAKLPAEIDQIQKRCQAAQEAKKQQFTAMVKEKLNEAEQIERTMHQQFSDVVYEYRTFFPTPVSRPTPVSTPLSVRDAIMAQNALAEQLKASFSVFKRDAVDKKRVQVEAEKAEQARQAAALAAEEEERRRKAEEAERKREAEYLRELERGNGGAFKKFMDFFTG